MKNPYTNLGRFEFSGIATGGGHKLFIKEEQGLKIPPRKSLIEIDLVKLEALKKWQLELQAKFNT